MEKLVYRNPILQFDFSDPDAIRVGEDFFMIASSFNHAPGVPVLHSKNLVEWKIINYVFDELPFERFKKVQHGDGAWAPAIRYHNGIFYAVIPFPDEGIYVSETTDPFGKWSPLRCLIPGKGLIDPCPIWTNDKCYVAVGFAKSRIGFNSCIGLFEVSTDLTTVISDYKIIYDGHDNNPTIEGPKFNVRGDYYYILCPAGSVKGGWQVALRSKNIYGPYESKVILMQNGTKINGPHQGALIDLDDNDNWAFIHFQDMWAYGRIVHLEPVTWAQDWPLCGEVNDPLIAGAPVAMGHYPVDIKTGDSVQISDDFKTPYLSLMWQTPANKPEGMCKFGDGLVLNCIETKENPLHLVPQVLTTKVPALSFNISVDFVSYLKADGDETGFTMMGESYTYLCLKKEEETVYLCLFKGTYHTGEEVVYKEKTDETYFNFMIKCENEAIYDLKYTYYVNGKALPYTFYAKAGRWIGTTYGIYARGVKDGGFARFTNFNVDVIK